jgi:hypothetical protein
MTPLCVCARVFLEGASMIVARLLVFLFAAATVIHPSGGARRTAKRKETDHGKQEAANAGQHAQDRKK